MRKLALSFILILTVCVGYSQIAISYTNLSAGSYTQPSSINACGTAKQFRINLKMNGDTASTVYLIFKFADGIEMSGAATILNADPIDPELESTDLTNPNRPVVTLSNLSQGTDIDVSYSVTASCPSFPLSEAYDTAFVSTTMSPGMINAAVDYSVNSPILQEILPSRVNMDNFVASFGQVFTRQFSIQNSGSVFQGDLRIVDNHGSALEIDSIWTDLDGVTQTFDFATSTLLVRRPNAPATASDITIYELVRVVDCLAAGNDAGVSDFGQCSFGCENDLCSIGNLSITPATVQRDNNDAPKLQVLEAMDSEARGTCLPDTTSKHFWITNTGQFPAVNTVIELDNGLINSTYTGIDTGAVSMELNGQTYSPDTINNYTANRPNRNCFINSGVFPISRAVFVVDTLQPGDTAHLYFDQYECCPGSSYDGWTVFAATQDYCDINYSDRAGNTWQNNVFTQSVIRDRVNLDGDTVLDPQVDTVFVNFVNQDLANLAINPDSTGVLRVRFGVDTGLCFIPGSFELVHSVFGTYIPDTIIREPDTTAGGYAEWITAEFTFDPGFWNKTNKPPVNWTNMFVNSSFNVLFEACCPAREPIARLNQRVSIIPGTNCTDVCEIGLNIENVNFNVQCPGCEVPGHLVYDFSMNRINLDYWDANTNRLADIPLVQIPDTLANIDRGVFGDTIELRAKARMFDGMPYDSLTQEAISLGQLQYELDHLNIQLAPGNFLDLTDTGIFIQIFDADGVTYPEGWFSTTPGFSGGQWLYDFSLDELRSQGIIDANYTGFDDNDEIWVRTLFTVDVPGTPNENDILYNINFKARGSSVVGADASNGIPASQLEVDSTLVFLCEGNGAENFYYPYNYGIGFGTNRVIISNAACIQTADVRPFGRVGSGANYFMNEFRDLTQVDTIYLRVPLGYIYLDGQLSYDPPGSATNRIIDAVPIKINDTTYAFEVKSNVILRDNNPPADGLLTAGYQGTTPRLIARFIPDCINTRVGFAQSNVLGTAVFDFAPSMEKLPGRKSAGGNNLFRFIIPELNIIPAQNETTVTSRETCINYSVENAPDSLGNSVGITHLFTFLYDPNNLFTNVRIIEDNSNTFGPDSNGFYQIGALGTNQIRNFQICVNVECNGTELDTLPLEIYTGWNCGGYPDSLTDTICYMDTNYYFFELLPVGIVDSLVAIPGKVCDTVPIVYTASVTGQGDVLDVMLGLFIPDSIIVVDSTFELNINGNITLVQPTSIVGNSFQFDMNVLDTAFANGFSSGIFSFSFDIIQNGCADLNEITMTVEGFTYCNDTISQVTGIEPLLEVTDAMFSFTSANCFELLDTIIFTPVLDSADHFWDFGDGNTSMDTVVSHFYSTPGTYQVIHSINSICCSDLATETLNIVEKCCPVLALSVSRTPEAGYPGIPVTYEVTVTNQSGHPLDSASLQFFPPDSTGNCSSPATLLSGRSDTTISLAPYESRTFTYIVTLCADESIRFATLNSTFRITNLDTLCNTVVEKTDGIFILGSCPFVFTPTYGKYNDQQCVGIGLDVVDPRFSNAVVGYPLTSVTYCISYPDSLLEFIAPGTYDVEQIPHNGLNVTMSDQQGANFPVVGRRVLTVTIDNFGGSLTGSLLNNIKFRAKCSNSSGGLMRYIIQDGCGITMTYDLGGGQDSTIVSFIDPGDLDMDSLCSGNKALDFAGLKFAYIVAPAGRLLENIGVQNFTLEARIKPIYDINTELTLLSNRDGANSNAHGFSWIINEVGKPALRVRNKTFTPKGAINLYDGECHTTAVRRFEKSVQSWQFSWQWVEVSTPNGKKRLRRQLVKVPGYITQDYLEFYADGVSLGELKIADGTDLNSSLPGVILGVNPFASTSGFEGDLDELRIWGGNISPNIADNMATDLNGTEGMEALLEFSEGGGLISYDATGNANDVQMSANNNGIHLPLWIEFDCTPTGQPPAIAANPGSGSSHSGVQPLELIVRENPFTNETQVIARSADPEQSIQIQVVSLTGSKTMMEASIRSNQSVTIGSGWPTGIYFVKAVSGNTVQSVKVVKLR